MKIILGLVLVTTSFFALGRTTSHYASTTKTASAVLMPEAGTQTCDDQKYAYWYIVRGGSCDDIYFFKCADPADEARARNSCNANSKGKGCTRHSSTAPPAC